MFDKMVFDPSLQRTNQAQSWDECIQQISIYGLVIVDYLEPLQLIAFQVVGYIFIFKEITNQEIHQ